MRLRHGGVSVPIECAQVNRICGAASWAANPQKPIAGPYGGTDCGREQHGHALGLALVPSANQALSILKHLGVGCTARGSFFLGGLPALIFHPAAIEAHGPNGRLLRGPVKRKDTGAELVATKGWP